MTVATGGGARVRAGAALLLIALAAVGLQRGATAPWAVARPPDGSVVTLSPIGLVRLGAGGSEECRWWPQLGSDRLCAVAPGAAPWMSRVRRAYPLAVIAMWTAVTALFVNVLAIPRRAPWVGTAATATASAIAAMAVWSMTAAGHALAALAGAAPRFGEAGFLSVAGAAIGTAVATGLLTASRRKAHSPQ